MKYATPTIEILQMHTEDICNISLAKSACYGESMGFWDGYEEEM